MRVCSLPFCYLARSHRKRRIPDRVRRRHHPPPPRRRWGSPGTATTPTSLHQNSSTTPLPITRQSINKLLLNHSSDKTIISVKRLKTTTKQPPPGREDIYQLSSPCQEIVLNLIKGENGSNQSFKQTITPSPPIKFY